jgi:hypothetical protein
MLSVILFLLGIVCAAICVVALLVALATTIVQGVLSCVTRSLGSFNDGRLIIALLYLIPAGLLISVICDAIRLALSFYFAVFK